MIFSKEEKARWLEEWEQSGKSISAYVKEKGLVRWTFTKWLKADRGAKTGFVEVPTQAMQPGQGVPEILIEKGDMKIHIPLVISGGELRAVIEGLGVAL